MGKTLLMVEGPLDWKGKRVLRFRARTESTGWLDRIYRVRDQAESLVDAAGLFSYRIELRQREGRYRSHKWYTFEGKRATYVRAGRPPRHYETPGKVQDALSAFYKVRTMDLRLSGDFEIPVFDSKKNWRVRVRVHRRERIDTLWGPIDTLVVEPELKSDSFFRRRGRVWLWVTTDPLHVPVRLESATVIGSFAAHLIGTKGLPYGPLARPPLRKPRNWRPSARIVRKGKGGVPGFIKNQVN